MVATTYCPGNQDLVLSGRLNLKRIWLVKKELLQALLQHPVVTVRLVAVEDVDLSFLQMLCAARKLARERQQELLISGLEEPAIAEALQRYGFSRGSTCSEACADCLWQQPLSRESHHG